MHTIFIKQLNEGKKKFMYKKDDCNFKLKEYARAFILPQPYENLFTCKEAFIKGTVFKDLYEPYDENKKSKC